MGRAFHPAGMVGEEEADDEEECEEQSESHKRGQTQQDGGFGSSDPVGPLSHVAHCPSHVRPQYLFKEIRLTQYKRNARSCDSNLFHKMKSWPRRVVKSVAGSQK